MGHGRLVRRPLALLAALVLAGCGGGGSAGPGAGPGADAGPGTDAAPGGGGPGGGADVRYVDAPPPTAASFFVTGALVGTQAPLATRQGALEEEGCPFPPDSAPCQSEACAEDSESAACEEVIVAWCADHPDHPECGDDPGGPGGDCPLAPGAYPCHQSVCEDWSAPACQLAVWHYCGQHADDPGCPASDECPFLPGAPPCHESDCHSPESAACAAIIAAWCAEHPEAPACGGNYGHGPGGPVVETFTPTRVWFKVHRVAFSEDAQGCTDPIEVPAAGPPEWLDFAANPTLVTGDPLPPGEYPCVIITVSSLVRWEVEGSSACPGVQEQVLRGHVPAGVTDFEAYAFDVYLSTAGTPTGGPGHGGSPPGIRLAAPHVAGPDVVASTFYVDLSDRGQLHEGGECSMEAPEFGFTTAYVVAPQDIDPLAAPGDCQPDPRLHEIDSWGEPCLHMPVGMNPEQDGWYPIEGSAWARKEYTNGPGDTCETFGLLQWCPDQHGAWMALWCTPPCP